MSSELVPVDDDEAKILKEMGESLVEGDEPVAEDEAADEASPPAQEEEAPEQDEASGGGDDERPKDGRTVPLAALKESREKERRHREENIRLQQRMDQMLKAMEGGRPEPVRQEDEAHAQPSIEDDPVSALKSLQDQFIALQNQQTQATKARQEDQRLAAAVNPYIASFREGAPDYDQARQHVMQSVAMGATLSGADPRAQVADFERNLARSALQQGRNPAEVLYQYAQQIGYAGVEQPAPEPERPSYAGAAQKVQEKQARAKRHRSLSEAGGRAPSGKLSARDIIGMDDAKFNKMMQDGDFFREMEQQLESLPQS